MGIGHRYQCRECGFNLHLHCGHCPTDLSSFMHPQHRLQLTLVQRSRATFSNERACEVCGQTIGGLFYKCKRCQVYIHPLCSQLPQYVCYIDDAEHNLELQKPEQANGCCAVCGEQCRSWHYKCGSSAVSLHIECLMAPLVPSTSRLPPPGNNRSIVVCSSSQTTRSYAVPWWWYCIALIGILQLLRFMMG